MIDDLRHERSTALFSTIDEITQMLLDDRIVNTHQAMKGKEEMP